MFDAISDYWTAKPPSEDIPDVESTNEFWEKEYANQRRDRMQDAIDDYLSDDKVSARQTYEDVMFCLDDVINYHKKHYDKAVEVKELMCGYRPDSSTPGS
ncbi:hypothetical protein Syn7803C97_29 [Synechococcus phage S-MbCM6]|jgi:hypothetical protein|uniref:Uncharacterized protein n=3 Tax=Namakavirus smbcm6 TaxID=2734120 RepID=H8ZMD4_9CAUD|nr:hypothetical protein [Synechococcus phage ACG-2014c]AHB80663.1 hypothetical protein S-MbCM25_028 [Synechococcus phage S-MbCM25]AFD02645.1 hypothetical protein [Synechococcus phage ACG-2014c]AIX14422.1 hypothetical protein Syn7803C43_27 [Synechococcus phage ACG-2014c]AIX22582.1 hypothetical protein Syn7803C97_29 [Synechococcus phage ACG-2014c]AIX22796.1 hypothetical protein Syn7803C98_28 [Synechococcus phage ACG-2014c]